MRLKQEVIDILNTRLKDEMTAFYTYRAIVNWANDKGYSHIAKYYTTESEDELVHAKKLEDLASGFGERLILPQIETPQLSFEDYTEVLDLNEELEVDLYISYDEDSKKLLELGENTIFDYLAFHRGVQLESVMQVKTLKDRIAGVEKTEFNLRQMEKIVFKI